MVPHSSKSEPEGNVCKPRGGRCKTKSSGNLNVVSGEPQGYVTKSS